MKIQCPQCKYEFEPEEEKVTSLYKSMIGKRRWKGLSKEEVSQIQTKNIKKRWSVKKGLDK